MQIRRLIIWLREKNTATFIYEGWNEDKKEYIKESMGIYVGMPCTYNVGSDLYPAFVSRISDSGKTVWIKDADWKADIDNGYDYFVNQVYIITPNNGSPEQRVSKRKTGRWMRNDYSGVGFGNARKYSDPTF